MSIVRNSAITDQVLGAVVDNVNNTRLYEKDMEIDKVNEAFYRAQEQVDKVRAFISNPEGILGSDATKHGEIAERVEVGIRNARAIFEGTDNLPADIDSVPRTGAADYLLNNTEVQSKFINGANNNLKHVLDHMDKYPNFGRDGSFYHIPKDTHELISKIMSGEDVDGLSQRSIDAIKAKVSEIEKVTGQPFNTVVQPGVSDYAEVQRGAIDETLNKHEEDLRKESERQKDQLEQDYGPSFQEMGRVALTGGAVGGGVAFASKIYNKYKSGKNVFAGDFNQDDWKEVGLETSKGAAIGAVSSAAIYGLTNYASMAAPFASAVVSASKGVGILTNQYINGEITFDEYMNLGLVVCSESAMVGVFTAAGQAIIPIPVLGAVIGSIAGKMFVDMAGSANSQLAKELNSMMDEFTKNLDAISRQALERINKEFDKLGDLTTAAFDFNNNLLDSSVKLAKAYGVSDSLIIKSSNELDDFMLS
ncbi:hypothetical protein MOU92_004110 [Vibrio parahaemolyticus]|uniref:hypothetical protein n=1 Tax=Vibrio parahaemolyticus TaxID=670 RepID=UPI0027E487AC|nr:hypothetical protein [Vibrio parahaemolyticus]EHR6434596.1 hypothetical protein [Vibrio parahaemolyticus]EHR6582646.1 hypothetical protein [Vibrio parahaemolyticus]EIU6790958.1 hypothetical protein [Vibrio parahaemolyticus]EIZ1317328.1 hypothetical protein [Vibrio parahaemolyticus]WMN67070.1 hypothetical protein NI387_09545 [Vibrio parahaemolyticus]